MDRGVNSQDPAHRAIADCNPCVRRAGAYATILAFWGREIETSEEAGDSEEMNGLGAFRYWRGIVASSRRVALSVEDETL